jgi:hypothetical protein
MMPGPSAAGGPLTIIVFRSRMARYPSYRMSASGTWRERILRARAREMNEVTSTQWVNASRVPIAQSIVPRLPFVGLVAYELGTIDSWREWRLQRKRFFAETVRDYLIAHVCDPNFGIFSLLVSRVAPLGRLIAIEAGAPRDDSKSSIFRGWRTCVSKLFWMRRSGLLVGIKV